MFVMINLIVFAVKLENWIFEFEVSNCMFMLVSEGLNNRTNANRARHLLEDESQTRYDAVSYCYAFI